MGCLQSLFTWKAEVAQGDEQSHIGNQPMGACPMGAEGAVGSSSAV